MGRWSTFFTGQGGFVVPGDGSAKRSYIGVHVGAGYALTQSIEVGTYLRFEAEDEKTFIDRIDDNRAAIPSSSGVAVGIAMSAAL